MPLQTDTIASVGQLYHTAVACCFNQVRKTAESVDDIYSTPAAAAARNARSRKTFSIIFVVCLCVQSTDLFIYRFIVFNYFAKQKDFTFI